MNKQHVQNIIDDIKAHPENFEMKSFLCRPGYDGAYQVLELQDPLSCGTAACIGGFCAIRLNDEGLFDGQDFETAIEEYFEMDPGAGWSIGMGDALVWDGFTQADLVYEDDPDPDERLYTLEQITADEAINLLTHLKEVHERTDWEAVS